MTLAKQWPFDEVKAALDADIQGFLEQWFPNGKKRGREYLVGNLAGDAGESLSINLDTGEWCDFGELSEPKGKDLLSLYAAARCGGGHKAGRTEACKQLAAQLGISPQGNPPVNKVVRLIPKDKKEKFWESMVPPPDGVGAPNLGSYTHKHIYRGPDGKPWRYVARVEKDGKKDFYPHTYGTDKDGTGWKKRHPNNPMCLFGLDTRAARPDARVLVQEGELKTERVGGLLGEEWCCMAWGGGHNRVLDHDWTPIAGADVVLCGDNDAVGRRAIERLAAHLRELGCTVTLIDLTGQPGGWDLGNAVGEEGWTRDRIEGFLKDRGVERFSEPDLGDVDGPEWADEPRDPSDTDERRMPPVPLGYDNGIYYYLSPLTGQIESLTRRQHKKDDLVGIAGLEFFERLDKYKTGQNGALNWTEIKNYLQNQCHKVGFYNPDRVRRRGAWLDGELAVLNLGDRLIVDGKSTPLMVPGSPYTYEAAPPLKYVVADPLTAVQAEQLLEICNLFRWEKPINGTLMAGWIMTAAICGALSWRPAIWVTGGSGSGKSTLERLVVKRILGGIGLFKKGGTTEAGIRQQLGRDARPVIFDEAESESAKAKGIMQGLLDLNRQSSSEDGAEITKGTHNQSGAITYRVRSSFLFSSINLMLEHLADESRVTVVELVNTGAADPDAFDALVKQVTDTITAEFAAGFVARAVWLMPAIRANAETFARAVAVHLGSARVGDQIGTLLAGAYACKRDGLVSFDAALKWVREQTWDNTTSANAAKDEERLTLRLFQQRIKIDLTDKVIERTVGEALAEAAKDTGTESMADLAARDYQTALKRYGLKVEDGGVWVSNTHEEIKKWLKDSPWASQWGRALKRLPGAKSSEPKTIAFGKWDKTKAVWVPLAAFEG